VAKTTRYNLFGDKEMAKRLTGLAKIQLANLRQLMKFSNLKQYGMTMVDDSGFVIQTTSVFGAENVNIFFPPPGENKENPLIPRQPVYMMWDLEPPYWYDENDEETEILDFELPEMFDDPLVTGGHFFYVTVRNGYDADGNLLSAKFSVKPGVDNYNNEYPGWSVEQGKQISGSYRVDGKSATVKLAADVFGNCTIYAKDLQTVLKRFVKLVLWKILYVPYGMSGAYVVADEETLDPTENKALGVEPAYWGSISGSITPSYTSDPASTPSYTYVQVDMGIFVLSTAVIDGVSYTQYANDWWVKRIASTVTRSATLTFGSLWTITYNAEEKDSWVAVKMRQTLLVLSSSPPPTFSPPTNAAVNDVIAYGYTPIKHNIFKYMEYTISTTNTWYADSSHHGFFTYKVTSEEHSFLASNAGYTAGWVDDCPWLEVNSDVYTTTTDFMYVHNRSIHELAEAVNNNGSISGEFGKSHHVRCYKKENILFGGKAEEEDICLVTYDLGTNSSVTNKTKSGYMLFSADATPEKEYSTNSSGIHDLITIDGVNYQCNGHIVLHVFS
jgi:hypothetical protein